MAERDRRLIIEYRRVLYKFIIVALKNEDWARSDYGNRLQDIRGMLPAEEARKCWVLFEKNYLGRSGRHTKEKAGFPRP